MWSGRHLFVIGALACAGLVSVDDSRAQVRLGYEIADVERQLHEIRRTMASERAELQTLRTPPRVMDRASALRLGIAPASDLAPYQPEPERTGRTHGPGATP